MELVRAAVRQDPTAQGVLMSATRPLVLRYCRARIRGTVAGTSAEDLAQDICIAVLAALPRFRDQGRPFMALVYGIASRMLADLHRTRSRHRVDALDAGFDAESTGAGPDELALRRETRTELDALLATVTERAREVLTLRIVVGLTAEETGAVLGISSGAVRVAQHRALVQMRATVASRARWRAAG